ncbi:hypothetical protein [Microbispora sp. ATCC PTA-5024]|uniref:hypothetical protein n=1 Tax=Microbispora sp. ATCC PTA-5024 TaxID=316330 RepID=UPI0003DD8AEB|nr:hypothetical protein [Microbispora sp. ATCC PTA-5024]ETK36126.1 hypothetical protein MPTA5024_10905 [Microbispora sp. ATCC PTA-5024]
MARQVLVKDVYQSEHWINEDQLAYAPWKGCEVLDHRDIPDYEEEPSPPAAAPAPETPTPRTTSKAARPASDDKE